MSTKFPVKSWLAIGFPLSTSMTTKNDNQDCLLTLCAKAEDGPVILGISERRNRLPINHWGTRKNVRLYIYISCKSSEPDNDMLTHVHSEWHHNTLNTHCIFMYSCIFTVPPFLYWRLLIPNRSYFQTSPDVTGINPHYQPKSNLTMTVDGTQCTL